MLRSATVIRLEGGELWGWEGQHIGEGSCEGSCTHVWNYQQALAWLFPALERTLRETEFAYNQLPNGGLTFRQRLPLGSGFDIIGPCADGHFGATIKAYREWRNSGDDAWLEALLAQHQAVDRICLVAGKSGPLGSGQDRRALGPPAPYARHGAVRAEFLADQHVSRRAEGRGGDGARRWASRTSPRNARRSPKKGGAYVDSELFNGRYYAQKLDLDDRSMLEPFDQGRKAGVLRDCFMQAYWSDEYGEIKYQIGGGCLTDQILGQWHADLAGLGDLFSRENVDVGAARRSIRENFRPNAARSFQSLPRLRL